jgi:beta-galactosidase
VLHDGNFVMDGMLLPDGTPTPGLAEFTKVNQQIVFDLDDGLHVVPTATTPSSTDIYVSSRSRSERLSSRPRQYWRCLMFSPKRRATVTLPDDLVSPGDGETWLTVKAELAAPTPWADHGHEVALGQFELTVPSRVTTLPAWPPPPTRTPDQLLITLGPAQFDARTGRMLRLDGMEVDGPRLELWRGPTDNDRSSARGSFELASPEDTHGEGALGPSSAQRWRDRGLAQVGAPA